MWPTPLPLRQTSRQNREQRKKNSIMCVEETKISVHVTGIISSNISVPMVVTSAQFSHPQILATFWPLTSRTDVTRNPYTIKLRVNGELSSCLFSSKEDRCNCAILCHLAEMATSMFTVLLKEIQSGPKKVSHYQELSLNCIKNRQCGYKPLSRIIVKLY